MWGVSCLSPVGSVPSCSYSTVFRYSGVGGPGAHSSLPGASLSTRPVLQGLLTFGYLVLLSHIGERMAMDMRRALFSSLLRYCQL